MNVKDFDKLIKYLIDKKYIYETESLNRRLSTFKSNDSLSLTLFLSDCCDDEYNRGVIMSTIGDRSLVSFDWTNSRKRDIHFWIMPLTQYVKCELPYVDTDNMDLKYLLKISWKGNNSYDIKGVEVDFNDMSQFDTQFIRAKKNISHCIQINDKVKQINTNVMDKFITELGEINADIMNVHAKYDAKLKEYNNYRKKIIDSFNKELELNKDFEE